MSQDTHLFSARRPRETLGGLNANSGYSGIPLPQSAMKRSHSQAGLKDATFSQAPYSSQHGRSQSSSRMSLAPGRPPQPMFQRMSTSGNNDGNGGRPARASMAAGLGSRLSFAPGMMTPRAQHGGGMTMAMGGGGGSQGQGNFQRRSSVFSRPSTSAPPTGQQSFFVQAPVPAGVPVDRRKLRDRNVQVQMAAELEDFLAQNNFQMEMKHALRPDSLRSPSQKDFAMMFQWLYKRIDPGYTFQKSMDSEVPPILKQLRYPFEKSITKSGLMAVGGEKWPTYLGVLHWMMQLATMMERYGEDRYDWACAEEGIDMGGDRIIFRFLGNAYQTWLSCPAGEDEEDEAEADKQLMPHIDEMAAEFERSNAQYAEELRVLEAENESLRKRIEEAEREAPDLGELQRKIDTLESAAKENEAWNNKVNEKLTRREQQIQAIIKEIEEKENELEEAAREKASLQEAVDKQGISVADIDRMNGERERLQSSLDAARTQLGELQQKMKDKETEAGDKLANLEALARQYNTLCYDVGMRDAKFELALHLNEPNALSSSQMGASVNGGGQQQHRGAAERLLADPDNGYHPSRILSLDLRGLVKNHVRELRRDVGKRRDEANDRDEDNKRLLSEISEAIDDKKQEVEALEHRQRSIEQEFEKLKETTQTQKHASDAQIEKMEKELAKMRSSFSDSVQLMEQREMNTNIEYEQLQLRANSLREELHTEIERMLNDIVKFKLHIQSNLEEYENFVDGELEKELGRAEEAALQQQKSDDKEAEDEAVREVTGRLEGL